MSDGAGGSLPDPDGLPVLDYATAEAIVRAHIAHLRERIHQERCVAEQQVWATAADELAAALPLAVSERLCISGRTNPAAYVVRLLVLLLVVLLVAVLTVCASRATMTYVSRRLCHPFRQRAELAKWQLGAQRVPWIREQVEAQAEVNLLMRSSLHRQLCLSMALLVAAEGILLGLVLLPSVTHTVLGYLVAPHVPFFDKLLTLVFDAKIVRAVAHLYLLRCLGALALSFFFGLLVSATNSAKLVLKARPAQSLVPALHREYSRRRHAELLQVMESQKQQLLLQAAAPPPAVLALASSGVTPATPITPPSGAALATPDESTEAAAVGGGSEHAGVAKCGAPAAGNDAVEL